MTTIDLNADLGEGDAYDLKLLALVSSCNIACGGHAGDAASMSATVRQAIANGVAIGAHPAYPDRAGFGRRNAFLVGDELRKSIINQIDALSAIVDDEAGLLTHVKPHGALYSDAAQHENIAGLFISAAQTVAPHSAIVGPPHSALQRAAKKAGRSFIAEAFVDRAYLPDGTLVPRSEPGAVHADVNTITSQAVNLATHKQVTTQNGEVISVVAATLCVHGDTPNAGEIARAVRDVLQANGVTIRAAG